MSVTSNPSSLPSAESEPNVTGWATLRLLNRYHWFVFVVAALGWLVDCMDQQLFNLAAQAGHRRAARPADRATPQVELLARRLRTSIFLIGWATGGIVFGILGDRWGRVKTMLLTILLYSLFTGLSALSRRRLGLRLLPLPDRPGRRRRVRRRRRPAWPRSCPTAPAPSPSACCRRCSAVGNITAALLFMLRRLPRDAGGFFERLPRLGPVTAWRVLFVIGIAAGPARPARPAAGSRSRRRGSSRWSDGGDRKQGRLLRRAVRRPAVAAARPRRPGAGVRRRRRPVGHRLLQRRPAASTSSTRRPRHGPAGWPGDENWRGEVTWGGHHLADAQRSAPSSACSPSAR